MKREYRVADELGKQRSIGKFREFAEDGASVRRFTDARLSSL